MGEGGSQSIAKRGSNNIPVGGGKEKTYGARGQWRKGKTEER